MKQFKKKLEKNWKWLLATLIVVLGFIIIPQLIDENKQAISAAKKEFQAKTVYSKNDLKKYSIFLPQGYTIISEDDNNFVIAKGAQQYIVFINEKENAASQRIYKQILSEDRNYAINETFHNQKKFGYLLSEKKNKKYYLTVGIGGIKMTTITNRSSLANDAKEMMRIVKSIQINQKIDE